MTCHCCQTQPAIISAPYRCLTVYLCADCYEKMKPMLTAPEKAEIETLEYLYSLPAAEWGR